MRFTDPTILPQIVAESASKMPFQENRANQVICTGISQIVLGCLVFTLSFILSKRREELGDIFEIGVEYWAAIPVSSKATAGVLSISSAHLLKKLFSTSGPGLHLRIDHKS